MCGIAGFLQPGPAPADAAHVLRGMTDAIHHRGPDAEGLWVDAERGIGLGHRRLSIIDLSAAGSQPMHSHDGRFVICFNGEIYNYEALRSACEQRRGGVAWRGHSDTEVLLETIADLGAEAALAQLDGMFALAVYDRQARTLVLARDPFGEKPLYYGWVGNALVFASELGAVARYPGHRMVLNRQAAADFFKYGYVPAPATICEGLHKLEPASWLAVGEGDLARRHLPPSRRYWDMPAAALAARASARERMPADGPGRLQALHALMLDSTRRRMAADVPLGAMLSGGIDSSVVTALMQACSSRPVRTFSIGMDDPDYDEAGHARAVAKVLGTDHTELILSAADVQRAIPRVVSMYDEPFADSSQVPSFLVARLARESVTVALSGDGGDEIFGGYNRYFVAPRLWGRLGPWPASTRRMLAAGIRMAPLHTIGRTMGSLRSGASNRLAQGQFAERAHKLARVIGADDLVEFHDRLLSTAEGIGRLLAPGLAPQRLAERQGPGLQALSFADRAMLVDTANYLPDDVLTKVDRATMAVSLEVRTPFLNKALFDFAWALPDEDRAHAGEGKRLLRALLHTLVPRELVDRPKSGFAIPIGRWMRQGELRDWVEAGLRDERLRDAGILQMDEMRRRWAEHLSGRRNHDSFIWSVMMFQGWLAQAALPAPQAGAAATAAALKAA